MPDLTDKFHPTSAKQYRYYLAPLDAAYVYDALVGHGMLGNKVPPALTTVNFLSYCKKNRISHPNGKKCWCRWISFRYMRNTGAYRYFGIPNPFAYEKLSRCISGNWDDIRKKLIDNSSSQPYTVSKVHLRKMHKSKAIFEMSYSNQKVDYAPIPALFVGKRYVVHCDVSQCFPSIYTHAVDWAIRGKTTAKANINGGNWSEQLDKALQSTMNGETHGIPIGPHASNVVSELLLTSVDKALFDNGFRFERAIDDYSCYVETHDEAEQFIIRLETELQKYGLTLNQKKTKIQSLPQATADSWVTALKSYRFANDQLDFKDISNYLNFTIGLMKRPGNDWRVLLYALKTAGKKTMTNNASEYYCNMILHLTYIYPYLIPHFEDMLGPQNIKLVDSKMSDFLAAIFNDGLRRRDYLTASFSLYYAMHFDKDFGDPVGDPSSVLEPGDCLLKLFALLYAKKYEYKELENSLVKDAQNLAGNADDFNENWLFCYEALSKSDLDNFIPQKTPYKDSWKAIKKAKVSFIDDSQL